MTAGLSTQDRAVVAAGERRTIARLVDELQTRAAALRQSLARLRFVVDGVDVPRRRRSVAQCLHVWRTVRWLTDAAIDANDPTAVVALTVFGCPRCRAASAFPADAASFLTPAYREALRANLARDGWTLPLPGKDKR